MMAPPRHENVCAHIRGISVSIVGTGALAAACTRGLATSSVIVVNGMYV